jgi:hypothetical protein
MHDASVESNLHKSIAVFLDTLLEDAKFLLSYTLIPEPAFASVRIVFQGPDVRLLRNGSGQLLEAIAEMTRAVIWRVPESQLRLSFEVADSASPYEPLAKSYTPPQNLPDSDPRRVLTGTREARSR